MNNHFSFRCNGCHARIKAAFQLRGQRRSCPGCGYRVIVPFPRPDDAGPMLVLDGSPAVQAAFRDRD
jgi:DNA-directed RNA polymerase subunit RPC12/RpoP